MLLIIHDQCWSMGYIVIPTPNYPLTTPAIPSSYPLEWLPPHYQFDKFVRTPNFTIRPLPHSFAQVLHGIFTFHDMHSTIWSALNSKRGDIYWAYYTLMHCKRPKTLHLLTSSLLTAQFAEPLFSCKYSVAFHFRCNMSRYPNPTPTKVQNLEWGSGGGHL